MAARGARGRITTSDVEAVRARLRLAAPHARMEAVDELKSWQGAPVDRATGSAVLRAATVGYPWVAEVPDDVGELLVQLLWTEPRVVSRTELETAYSFCAERARRSILRTLALRADSEALETVQHLIGIDGPADLLPVPTSDLLNPLLVVPGVASLAPALVSAAYRRGWASHAGALLHDMARRGRLSPARCEEVSNGLAPLVVGLVDTCDRGATISNRGALVRVDRQRLASLVPLFAELSCDGSSQVLRRVLACADPRVAAEAAVALTRRRERVGHDRLELVARDPEARAVLLGGLMGMGRGFELPSSLRSDVALAEADVVQWLASSTQLGTAPDEVEHRGVVPAPVEWGTGLIQVFAFRVRPPHWSAERGWMLAAAGPFDPLAQLMPARSDGFAVQSLYASEDGDGLERHVLAISRQVVQARGEEAA